LSEEKKEVTLDKPADNLITVTKYSDNTGQELIRVTKDKVEICLMKYLDNIEKRNSWSTPLAILLTVILTLVTTSFKSFGLSAESWQAIFVVVGGLSAIWLVHSVTKRPKEKKIGDIIEALRSGE
jgi:Flp pilus assembly protein TadB